MRRNAVWNEFKSEAQAAHGRRIYVYSLRHLFARRCAMALPPVSLRAAAIAMGYSYEVDCRTYSQQFDLDGAKAAFETSNTGKIRRSVKH